MKKSNGAKIKNLPAPIFDVEGLAVNPKTGVVYGIGPIMPNLYKYDPGKKEWTPVGNTGQTWDNAGLAYHPGLHMLFACSADTGSLLYSIDPETGESKVVGDTGMVLEGGLAFAPGVEPVE